MGFFGFGGGGLCGVVWCVVWCGVVCGVCVVWCGVVGCVVWCGVVWCGVVLWWVVWCGVVGCVGCLGGGLFGWWVVWVVCVGGCGVWFVVCFGFLIFGRGEGEKGSFLMFFGEMFLVGFFLYFLGVGGGVGRGKR